MTTRRRYLAALGTLGATTLAGCETLVGSGDESVARVEESDIAGWTPDVIQAPTSLPFSLPGDRKAAHESRARTLLETVPTDPSIPNGVIEEQIRTDREHLETRLREGSDEQTPRRALDDWRRLRGDAANLYGSYNAGIGENDAEAIRTRRDTVRQRLGDFQATIDYSAASPIEAVLVYAPIESLLHETAQRARSRDPYPSDPLANVEQAGAAFESVEVAEAALEDARHFHEMYLGSRGETAPRWSTLVDSLRWLRIAVDRTRRDRLPEGELEEYEERFRDDRPGVEIELFRIAHRSVRTDHDPLHGYPDTGQYANGVLEAGRRLTAIAAFDAVVRALEEDGSGRYLAEETEKGQTVASLKSAAGAAAETLRHLPDADRPHLTAAIGDRAVASYRYGRQNLGGRYFDPEHAEASFRYARIYGALAPDAASFVADQVGNS